MALHCRSGEMCSACPHVDVFLFSTVMHKHYLKQEKKLLRALIESLIIPLLIGFSLLFKL